VVGPNHPETAKAIVALALHYHTRRKGPAALPLYMEAFEIQRRVLGLDHLDTLTTAANYSRLLVLMGKFADAEPILRDLLAARTKRSADDWHAGSAKLHLGEVLVGLRRFEEAEPFLREGYRNVTAHADPTTVGNRALVHMAAERLARLFADMEQPDKADEWRRRIIELDPTTRRAKAPTDAKP
jgi:eukaryotic-like serine/threonine-protein kinase